MNDGDTFQKATADHFIASGKACPNLIRFFLIPCCILEGDLI
jgi:hypothetical protein